MSLTGIPGRSSWLSLAFSSLAALSLAASNSSASPEGSTPMHLIAWPSLSPTGDRVAFEWLNDLWIAPSQGGEATRLTNDLSREAYPRFTPDGKRIVFSSDQTGAVQIHSIPVTGGESLRHTHHTGGNILESLSPDGKHAIVRGTRERSGHRATRLIEVDLTQDRRERRLFDATAHSSSWSPDGSQILFCRGGEQLYRKGYVGSRASRIWRFDSRDGSLRQVDTGPAEARSPIWHPDGLGHYYVSSSDGTFNLWSKRADQPEPTQLTFFKDDGVILPDLSRNGTTFIFRVGTRPFLFRPGKDPSPKPIEFWTRERLPDISTRKERATGTNHADFTPQLDQVVFSAIGDLWLTGDPRNKPKPLTQTPELESEIRFSHDGSRLFFLRDDGLGSNIISARLDAGKLTGELPLTRTNTTKSRLKPSPDGSRIAWIEGTGDLFTTRADGQGLAKIFECWDKPTFEWSPDGRWIVLAAKDPQANRDLWLVPADGSAKPVNLTRNPNFEGSPRWSPDGRFIAFTARRDESGEAALWLIDLGPAGLTNLPDQPTATTLGDRATRLSTRGVEPIRTLWAADSKSIWFQSSKSTNPRLYSVGINDGPMQTIAEYRGIPIRMTGAGELLWRVDRVPSVFKSGDLTRFPISLRAERPRADLLRAGFRRVWRTLGERFYDPKMNGLDWPAMLGKYEDLAASSRDSRQFDRVVGMLLGELNASHLTFLTDPWPTPPRPGNPEPPTAHTGMVFDDSKRDGPLKIRRIIANAPIALLPNAPKPGETIIRIAGQPITSSTPLHPILSGAAGRSLPLVIEDAKGNERTLELRCISYPRARFLDRKEHENANRSLASRAKNGRIAYLPFKQMKWEDFLQLEREIYRASLDHDGLILDLRDNGGGRVTDQLLAVFCQPVHARTIPRNGPEGYPTDRRVRVSWEKPLVVLCNENTYSNAEIFCHAIQQTGRALLVGTQTAGGVISAVSTRITGVGDLQIPFRGWYHAKTGANLDHKGAVPDHPVPLTPGDEDSTRDPQLRKAVEVLDNLIKPR